MSRTIDQIYDAVDDDEALARLPQVLAEAVDARSAITMEFDAGMQPLAFSRHGIPDGMQERFVELDLARHDIWSHLAFQEGQYDQAVLCEDYVDADTFRRTTFYNELYRPFGDDTARCLGVMFRRRDGFSSVGLHRSYRQRRFSERNQRDLEATLPHLRRLGEIRSRLAAVEARAGLMSAAMDALPAGLVVTDANGRVRHANAAAEAMLRAGDGVRLERGRIAAADVRAQGDLDAAVRTAAATTGPRGGAVRLRRAEGEAVRALAAPLNGTGGGVILLLDLPDGEGPDVEMLRALYELTPSEAELAVLLATGLSPAEAADARGVRLSTVRSQILGLLAKTGAASLGDLLRTLGRTPRLRGG